MMVHDSSENRGVKLALFICGHIYNIGKRTEHTDHSGPFVGDHGIDLGGFSTSFYMGVKLGFSH